MIIFAFFILTLAHLLPWVFVRKPLLESPAKLVALLGAVQILPQFLILALYPDRSLVYGLLGPNFGQLLATFGLLYAAGMIAFYGGLMAGYAGGRKFLPNVRPSIEIHSPVKIIIFLLAVYLFLMFQIFQSAGGVVEYVNNIGARATMLAGSGAYFIFTSPAAYMIVFLAIYSYSRTGRPSLPIVLLLIVLLPAVESLLGGRRQPMQLLIFSALAMSIYLPSFQIYSLRSLIILAIAMFLFVALLVARVGGDAELDVLEIVMNLSHIDPYLFVQYHFTHEPLWYGKSFLDVVQRILPIYDLYSPAPIDEGVYIYNLFLGAPVVPPTPLEDMVWNSWPAGTFGNGFMNFGYLGVFLFFFVRGLVIAAAFVLAKRSGQAPALLLIYLWMAFGFHLSNLKLTQLLMLIVGLIALSPIVTFLNKISARRPAT